ncbi:hypothetical protein DRQ09_01580 [candidate division KSB1 bacterium]|nr:MAG: hypothetical protein DRQ09_01580 [candidate division KSB1 bacterium]
MWYQILNLKTNDLRFRTSVGYAESSDGLTWEKPSIGIIDYKGSKDNNLVITCRGTSSLCSPAVVKDPYPSSTDETYKMIYWDSMSKEELKMYGPNFPLGKDVPGWKAIPGEGFLQLILLMGYTGNSMVINRFLPVPVMRLLLHIILMAGLLFFIKFQSQEIDISEYLVCQKVEIL